MAIKLMKGDEKIVAEGMVECLGIWDKMNDDDAFVFWLNGRPTVSFRKLSRKDSDGREFIPVLKVQGFGGNSIVQCWMSKDKVEGKHKFTRDKVVSSGMHTGNIGLDREGTIVHIINPEDVTRRETTDGLGAAF